VPVPPIRPFALRVSYYLFWSYRSRGCHTGGGGSILCRSPQSVKKNILRISYENRTISSISGSGSPGYGMTCAAPEGTSPRRFNELETPTPPSQEPVTNASRAFTIFHSWVRTVRRSYPFLLSPFPKKVYSHENGSFQMTCYLPRPVIPTHNTVSHSGKHEWYDHEAQVLTLAGDAGSCPFSLQVCNDSPIRTSGALRFLG